MYFLFFIKIVRGRKGFFKTWAGGGAPSMYAKNIYTESNPYNLGYHNKNIKHNIFTTNLRW